MSPSLQRLVAIILLLQCINTQVKVNRYICQEGSVNQLCSSIKFNDVAGEFENFLAKPFTIEFLLDGGSMDTAAWVEDNSYPNGGYQLFPVFGGTGQGAEHAGIYRFWDNILGQPQVEKLVSGYYYTDVAVDLEHAPDKFYAASVFHHAIEVFNLTSFQRIAEYSRFRDPENFLDTAFAGPDGLYADKKGNMYFTDIDLKVPIAVARPPQIKSGGIFRIDLLDNDTITLVHFGQYGYDGIDGNGADPNIIVATNSVDINIDEWEPFNNTVYNRTNMYIAQFEQQSDGSLVEIERLFSIDDVDREYFPTKPFLDGMTYDFDGNVWFATQVNHSESRLSIINGNGGFLGEILLGDEFCIAAITYNEADGYYYGGMVSIPFFRDGKYFRIPSINVAKKKRMRNGN